MPVSPIHAAAKLGFAQNAEFYQQSRPNYPQALLGWMQQLGLGMHSTVIDLGAGTGKFLPYLQQLTPHITAVEPIAAMLAELKRAYPHVATLQTDSTALAFANASLDAVVCAQSFHWFANSQSLTEIARVLKPNGLLLLFWNQRDTAVAWVKALADCIAPWEADTPRFHTGHWQQVLNADLSFRQINHEIFAFDHLGSVQQVVINRLRSTSFIAALPNAQQLQLSACFSQIMANAGFKLNDRVAFPYRCMAYAYQRVA